MNRSDQHIGVSISISNVLIRLEWKETEQFIKSQSSDGISIQSFGVESLSSSFLSFSLSLFLWMKYIKMYHTESRGTNEFRRRSLPSCSIYKVWGSDCQNLQRGRYRPGWGSNPVDRKEDRWNYSHTADTNQAGRKPVIIQDNISSVNY